MLLNFTLRVAADTDPAGQYVIDLLATAAARQASVWTQPVLLTTDPQDDGTVILTFQVDAVPRNVITTSRNVAAALRPPHIAR